MAIYIFSNLERWKFGLNRLTMYVVFNEESLFTFSKGRRDFDMTVPKNYLKV